MDDESPVEPTCVDAASLGPTPSLGQVSSHPVNAGVAGSASSGTDTVAAALHEPVTPVSKSVAERNVRAVAVNEARGPRVLMMCGPAGAGKTTYAKNLERAGWTRLSFEVEFWDRGITTMPPAEVVAEVGADLKARLLRHVAAGDDVVLDYGFWFRRQRDEFRTLLAPHGIVPETIYVATSRETILSRVGHRHGRHADDWPLTEQTAMEYFERFEPPTPAEGPLEVVR